MAIRKLRILALLHKNMVPPDDTADDDLLEAKWKTEFDVLETLRELGHDVYALGVGDELRVIHDSIDEHKPHIVFNLLEDFHEVPVFDQNVVAYLELLRVPYTGCNSRGLLLARDKALSKKVLWYHRVPIPAFTVISIGRAVRLPKRLTFPLIVKSLTKEASAGIAQASVVEDKVKLEERVKFIHEVIGTDAIIERYVPGQELYVGILGNQRLQVLPIWEMFFAQLPETSRPIATDRAKWNRAYQTRHGISTGPAKNLPEKTGARIQRVCKRVYRVLGLSGYARMDLRLNSDGDIFVLEANPNPQLAYGEDLSASAEAVGMSYEALLQRILSLGLRWQPDGTSQS